MLVTPHIRLCEQRRHGEGRWAPNIAMPGHRPPKRTTSKATSRDVAGAHNDEPVAGMAVALHHTRLYVPRCFAAVEAHLVRCCSVKGSIVRRPK